MAVLFKPYRLSLKTKSGKKLYHPRMICVGNVTTAQVAEEVAQGSALSTGDVKSAIDNLVLVMGRHLRSSQSVTLDGLGTFSLGVRSGGRGVEKEDEVSASQVKLCVRFRPAFTRRADGTLSTQALISGARCMRHGCFEVAALETKPAPGTPEGEAPDPID